LRGACHRHGAKSKAGDVIRKNEPSLDAYMDAAAATLGIPLDPAWKPTVRMNLETTFRFAALVEEFALPDEAEPAAVFRA
jgi:1-carboxybiuret hydrolase subunit AtzG-like protein